MKNLLAVCALLGVSVAWAADTPGHLGLWAMLCTQDGVSRGLKGKELEDFIGKCVKSRESGGRKEDPAMPPEDMANC